MFFTLVAFGPETSATEFQVSVKYLVLHQADAVEEKNSNKLVFFEELPSNAKVIGSLTVSAELGKTSKASAQVGKRTLELSVWVQKVEADEVTLEVEVGRALDRNPGRDYSRSHSTMKAKVDKPFGYWGNISNGVKEGFSILVTHAQSSEK
jgi:hypothetical protein